MKLEFDQDQKNKIKSLMYFDRYFPDAISKLFSEKQYFEFTNYLELSGIETLKAHYRYRLNKIIKKQGNGSNSKEDFIPLHLKEKVEIEIYDIFEKIKNGHVFDLDTKDFSYLEGELQFLSGQCEEFIELFKRRSKKYKSVYLLIYCFNALGAIGTKISSEKGLEINKKCCEVIEQLIVQCNIDRKDLWDTLEGDED